MAKEAAKVETDTVKNGEGRDVPATYAECVDSGHVEWAYGTGEASARAALAKLTEECPCGATWHEED